MRSGVPKQTCSRWRNICIRTGSSEGSRRKHHDALSTSQPPSGSGPRRATIG